jgi:hypothetical protein
MNCKELQLRIPDMIDGTIRGDEKTILEEHVAHCPECSREYAELSVLLAHLKTDEPWAPPQAYWNSLIPKIHDRIEQTSRPARLFPAWIRRSVVTAAAIAVVCAGINVVPTVIEERPDELRSVVSQVSPEEIQSFIERQEIEGMTASSSSSAANSLISADDKTDLREVIGEDESSIEVDDAVESLNGMNDNAVKDIVARLDQKVILN